MQQATTAFRRFQFDEAIALLSQLLLSQPGNRPARWMLVQSLESQHQTDNALEQLHLLLVHSRNDLAAIDKIAGHMRQRRYPLDIIYNAYENYLKFDPGSATAAFNYAYNLARGGRFEAAIEFYERALLLKIDMPEEVHLNIANVYMEHLHAHDKAREHLNEALDLNPGYSSAYYNLGNLSEQEGDRGAASENFRESLRADPTNVSALARLADTKKFTDLNDPVLMQLITTARQSENSDVQHALGRAYELLGHYELAWQHFTKANATDARTMPAYNPAQIETDFGRIVKQCTPDWLNQFGDVSGEPVFICGMFRSGSTLLEQMLASHPAFVAGGESEFFPRLIAREFPDYPSGLDDVSVNAVHDWQRQHSELTRKRFGLAQAVTDKRPDNFLYIGLIKALLPRAKILVTERDWRDVATSIYSVRLGPNQSYSTNLRDIRHYIEQQNELVNHWESLLGSDLIRVRYEDLVLQPRATLTDLLESLGHDWHDACLLFHELKNSVKTASVWQVREPLHDKSIGRWKNYHDQFNGVFGDGLHT